MPLISLEPEFIVNPKGEVCEGVLVIESGYIRGLSSVAPKGSERIKLCNKMLLPGFVNVHSHALQRALRGRVEQKSPTGLDDFWSWRTNMYKDAHRASLDDIEAIATLAYFEMLKSGFVAVGEFNYLHHQPSGIPFDDSAAVSKRLARAAERVGIRQVLLTCGYERKNFREKLIPEQERFGFRNASAFLQHAALVREQVQAKRLTHGIAIHSTRACSAPFIEEVSQSALAASGPFHMHACEQTHEVTESIEEYGLTPIEALKKFGALKSNSTLVHATHLSASDIAHIAASKAIVGLCPSTERNLGDGLCSIEDLLKHDVPLAIGTDQHVRLDPVSELRELEEQERLRLRRRCVIAAPCGSPGQSLIAVGTSNGRRSLGLSQRATWFEEPADLVAVELPTSYEVGGPIIALNEWLVSGSHHDVTDVFVNAERLVCERIANSEGSDIVQHANASLKRLFAR